MKNRYFVFCVLSVLFCSCVKQSYSERMITVLEQQFKDELVNYHHILLIPNSGCTGCISNAENFFKTHADSVGMKYVFTYFSSCKDLRIKFGQDKIQGKNVFLDEKNIFYFPKYQEAIYPIVATIEDGKLIRLENLDVLLSEE